MFKQIFKAFLGWKMIVFLFSLLAFKFIPFNPLEGFSHNYLESHNYFLSIWANFDGASYLNIAQNGYRYPLFAYFPFLPFLIGLVHSLTELPVFYAGLLINNLAFLLGLWIFYKITLLDFGQKIARRSLLLLLLFPASFFYGAIYTESLYFLFATLAFYFARKEKWLWAGIFGFFAGLSRLVGVSLLVAFLVEWIIQKGQKKNLPFIFLVPLAIIVYGLFLQFRFGDFFLFQKAMAHWYQADFVFPAVVFFRYAKILLTLKFEFVYFVALLELLSFIFYFFLAIYTFLNIRISYGVWMIISLLIPTFTGTFQSMPRYILHLFPAFIALSLMANSKLKFRIMAFIFLILQFFLVALFTRGYFIA